MLMFIYNFGFFFFITNLALFAEKQFMVGTADVGLYQAWIVILRVLLQTFLAAKILQMFTENQTLKSGILSLVIAMIFMIIITDQLLVYLPLIFMVYGSGVSRPILTSQLTNSVDQKDYATVLGVNKSLTSTGQIVTPILGGIVYKINDKIDISQKITQLMVESYSLIPHMTVKQFTKR